jgi:hypothetical protein
MRAVRAELQRLLRLVQHRVDAAVRMRLGEMSDGNGAAAALARLLESASLRG